MEMINKNQIITINTILSQKGLQDEKANIITSASGGRCSHTNELYYTEAIKLINFLNAQQTKKIDPRQKMFNHIIAMANEIGMVRMETKVIAGVGMRKTKNYDDMHKWIDKYGYLHKGMNEYSYKELPTLVTQFKKMWTDKMKLKS